MITKLITDQIQRRFVKNPIKQHQKPKVVTKPKNNKKVKDCEVLLVRPRKVFWYVSVAQTFAGEQEIIGKAFQLYLIVARPICSIWKSKIYQLSRRFLRQSLSYFTIIHSFLPTLTGWGRQFFFTVSIETPEKVLKLA